MKKDYKKKERTGQCDKYIQERYITTQNLFFSSSVIIIIVVIIIKIYEYSTD